MKDYLFGAVYIIEQDYTEEEIRRDLSLMRNHGCNLVTLWPVGNPWLAESSHEWKFDQTMPGPGDEGDPAAVRAEPGPGIYAGFRPDRGDDDTG